MSTKEQTQGYGIACGNDMINDYTEDRGWTHVDTFKDEGVSGSLPWEERSDMRRLVQLAQQTPRPFDVVVVPETRTIGRTDRVFWRWVWEMQDLGIFVAVVDKDLDNTTEDGEAAMREEANYAFEEYTSIRTRTQRGIQKKAKTGGWPCGVPPFGWRIENQGKKGKSTPALHEREAATCRRARELRVGRKSYGQIAAVLNSEGCVSRRGKPWTERGIKWLFGSHALLHNEVVFRSTRNAKLNDDGEPVHGPSVVVPLPVLFTDEQIRELEQAQAALSRPRTPQRAAACYPVSGRLISPCGGRYTGYRRKNRGLRLYRCSGRTCGCAQIDADILESRLWALVCSVLGDKQQLRAMSRDWGVLAAENRVNFTGRIAELDEEIQEQEDTIDLTTTAAARQAARRKLTRAKAQTAVDRAVKPLETELARLETERAQVVDWQQESQAGEQHLQDLRQLSEVARDCLHALPPQQQAEVLALLGLELKVMGPVPRRPAPGSPAAWFLDRGRVVPTLTDEAWVKAEAVITALDSGRGPKRLPARQVLTGILIKARTGVEWGALPPECGKPASIRQRWGRWIKSGAWEEIMDALDGMPGLFPALLPPIEMRGMLDPRAFIGHMAASEGSSPVEPLREPGVFDMASLDPAMWFHRPFRADEWFLYDQEPPIATGGRGAAQGRIYDHDGQSLVPVTRKELLPRLGAYPVPRVRYRARCPGPPHDGGRGYPVRRDAVWRRRRVRGRYGVTPYR